MNNIDQNLYVKNPSNINGLSYLPSFKNESDNDIDWPWFVVSNKISTEISDANKEALDDTVTSTSLP